MNRIDLRHLVGGLCALAMIALGAAALFAAAGTPSLDGTAAPALVGIEGAAQVSEEGSPEAAPEVPDLSVPGAACGDADPLALPGQEQQACCIDQCKRDRDCRFVCGKEFGGQCVMVNSCCRECFCFGFAPAPGVAI